MRLHNRTSRFHIEHLEHRRLLSFSAPVIYPMGDGPLTVVAGDFNRDSRMDLGSYPGLLLGNGNGTFHSGGTAIAGEYAAAADFNGDGKIDVLGLETFGVTLGLGRGDGTFQPRYFPTIGVPASAAVGDINGDGTMDVVLTSIVGNDYYAPSTDVEVLLGNGSGSVALAAASAFDGYAPSSCVLADFNGDGKLDFAAPGIGVMLGNGNGSFQTPTPLGGEPAIAAGDFNRDHKQDLVSASGYVLLGRGDGTFVGTAPLEVGDNPRFVTVADFNCDGKLDFATANQGHADYTAPPYKNVNGSVGLRLGNGDGTFGPLLGYAAGTSPSYLAVSDFNGDSFPDLAVSSFAFESDPNSIAILLNGANWTPKTYTGPTGGNWSSAGNWSPSGVPSANNLVSISGKSVNLVADATLANLTLTAGASLSVAANGNRVLRASTLSISADSKLDLNDNTAVIDSGLGGIASAPRHN